MPKVVVTDTKGLVQESGKGVVGLLQSKTLSASYTANSATISSGAIVIPANSLVTGIHTVVTTSLTGVDGAVNVKVGTAAGGTQIAGAANLGANLAGAVAGKGQSTNTELNTALAGAAALVITAGKPYFSAEDEIFITVTATGGNLTAGAVQFTVEFVTFS